MAAIPASEPVPIRTDAFGRLRVGRTNVLLDLVVYAFWQGETPETIAENYPSLTLGEVYHAIAYYYINQAEVDAYLRQQEAEAAAFQEQYERENPRKLTREILLARLAAQSPPQQ
ncbi:MAG: DUF433 domain-containing protein [Anaerolineae bacterium]|nr:DUF433 domain-containing protein [Anaerolineae bacterium]